MTNKKGDPAKISPLFLITPLKHIMKSMVHLYEMMETPARVYVAFLLFPWFLYILIRISVRNLYFHLLWVIFGPQNLLWVILVYSITDCLLIFHFISFLVSKRKIIVNQARYFIASFFSFVLVFFLAFAFVRYVMLYEARRLISTSAVSDGEKFYLWAASLIIFLFLLILLAMKSRLDVKTWNWFFDDFSSVVKSYWILYIFLILFIGSVIFLYILSQMNSNWLYTFVFIAIIFFFLAINSFIIKKIKYKMDWGDLVMFAIPIILICAFLCWTGSRSRVGFPEFEVFVNTFVVLVFFLVFSILLGAVLYWIFTIPWITIFILDILFYASIFWNRIQLNNKNSVRIVPNWKRRKDLSSSKLRLFMYYYFELLFLYVLLSLFSYVENESMSSIIGVPNFLIGNIRFLGFLAMYAAIFPLFVSGFKLNGKVIKTSYFHGIYSITVIVILLFKILTNKPSFEDILGILLFNSLTIFGCSFGFLIMTSCRVEGLIKYWKSKDCSKHFTRMT